MISLDLIGAVKLLTRFATKLQQAPGSSDDIPYYKLNGVKLFPGTSKEYFLEDVPKAASVVGTRDSVDEGINRTVQKCQVLHSYFKATEHSKFFNAVVCHSAKLQNQGYPVWHIGYEKHGCKSNEKYYDSFLFCHLFFSADTLTSVANCIPKIQSKNNPRIAESDGEEWNQRQNDNQTVNVHFHCMEIVSSDTKTPGVWPIVHRHEEGCSHCYGEQRDANYDVRHLLIRDSPGYHQRLHHGVVPFNSQECQRQCGYKKRYHANIIGVNKFTKEATKSTVCERTFDWDEVHCCKQQCSDVCDGHVD